MDYISTVFWCNPNLVDDVNRHFHWSYPHLYLAATSLLATRTRRRWPGIRRTTCGFDDALLEASMNSWFPSQPCLIAAGYTSIPKRDVVITQWILEAPYLDKPKSSLHTCCLESPLLQVPSDGWNGIPLPQTCVSQPSCFKAQGAHEREFHVAKFDNLFYILALQSSSWDWVCLQIHDQFQVTATRPGINANHHKILLGSLKKPGGQTSTDQKYGIPSERPSWWEYDDDPPPNLTYLNIDLAR